ncbi:MAG: Histone deacetylase superfamily, partial [Myxococcaceae bacterium]|nr:Histone deacetylase superfamily [Myxococcaceae bacterium]
MRAHGLLARLEAMGFGRVGVELELADPFEHTLRVYDGEPARRLGEITAARRHVASLGGVELAPGSEVFEIGWLAIENPDAHLTTPLPGQERPGLGLLRAVIDMALGAAVALRLAGVVGVPAHYHLASTYHPWFRPLDPRDEGVFLALRRATRGLSRRDASWAVARGAVTLDGAPWRWQPMTMCAPIDPALREWMTSSDYATAAVEGAGLGFALGATTAG